MYNHTNVTTKRNLENPKDNFNSSATTRALKIFTTKDLKNTIKTSSADATEASTTVPSNYSGKLKQDARSITKTDKDSTNSDNRKYIYIIVGLSVFIVVSALVLTIKRLYFLKYLQYFKNCC